MGVALVRGVLRRVGGPEAVPATSDVPIVESVDEPADDLGGPGQVVGVHPFADRGDQLLGLGQHVPVQEVLRVSAEPGPVSIDVGVQSEEAVSAPDRKQYPADHLVDPGVADPQVAASEDACGGEVPPEGIGALVLEDLCRLGVVTKLFGEFGAVLSQQDSVADHILERRSVEKGGGQDVEGIEPAPGLVDVLDNEVGREVVVEPLLVLKRVVDLGEGHGPRLKPAVQHLGDPPHGGASGRVVRVRPG